MFPLTAAFVKSFDQYSFQNEVFWLKGSFPGLALHHEFQSPKNRWCLMKHEARVLRSDFFFFNQTMIAAAHLVSHGNNTFICMMNCYAVVQLTFDHERRRRVVCKV